MPIKSENNRDIALTAIKRNITLMNAVILLVVYTLIFLNVKFLYKFLDYIRLKEQRGGGSNHSEH